MSKYFITGNRDKWSRFLASLEESEKNEWQQVDLEIVEIQGATAKEVAEDKALKAWKALSAQPGDQVMVQDDFWRIEELKGPECGMAQLKHLQTKHWLALMSACDSRKVTKTVAVTLYDGVTATTVVTTYQGVVGFDSRGSSGSVMDKMVIWEGSDFTSAELGDQGKHEVVNYPI
jgi:inosine/xanthosine triphosphate pyrophosphatase family protein